MIHTKQCESASYVRLPNIVTDAELHAMSAARRLCMHCYYKAALFGVKHKTVVILAILTIDSGHPDHWLPDKQPLKQGHPYVAPVWAPSTQCRNI